MGSFHRAGRKGVSLLVLHLHLCLLLVIPCAQAAKIAPVPTAYAMANVIQICNPAYPPPALKARVQGRVALAIWIDSKGGVTKAVPISGPSLLTSVAANAVMRWRFHPFNANGKAVDSSSSTDVAVQAESTVYVDFKLPNN